MLLEITNNLNNKKLINDRVIQTIIICLFSMIFCQVLKFIIISIKRKEVNWNILYSTGGFPSSHSGLCMSLVTSLLLFQLNDTGMLDWSFVVALIFSIIVIHDAMGVRLEASKHAKILNNLTSDMTVEEKRTIGFGKKGFLKEMLGHKSFEVAGGVFFGVLIGIIGFLIFKNMI